jgi:hypothetical protein
MRGRQNRLSVPGNSPSHTLTRRKLEFLKKKEATSTATSVTAESTSQASVRTEDSQESSTQRQVSWNSTTTDTGRSLGSSLSKSVTISKFTNFKKDLDSEIKAIRSDMEQQMNRQEKQLQALQQSIDAHSRNMEERVAMAVIKAMFKERQKVEEITMGPATLTQSAPLADESGRLPCGATVKAGGPLDRLHHVEITVLHMANILDDIATHLQMQTNASNLFSEEAIQNSMDTTLQQESKADDMITREYGGKRPPSERSPTRASNTYDEDNPKTENQIHPSKRRSEKPPATPDDQFNREQGAS